ncbi:hypothetical protein QZH41_010943 [Actinostola sp. cb2023]|nr:hypothetical protein QZH41_010943 [Actinostola sp. cb2023]
MPTLPQFPMMKPAHLDVLKCAPSMPCLPELNHTLVDGRVQVKMPWKENGPPKQSNYDIALKRMYSSERTFKKRDCFDIVEEEVQKLVGQGFVTKVPQEEVDHIQ